MTTPRDHYVPEVTLVRFSDGDPRVPRLWLARLDDKHFLHRRSIADVLRIGGFDRWASREHSHALPDFGALFCSMESAWRPVLDTFIAAGSIPSPAPAQMYQFLFLQIARTPAARRIVGDILQRASAKEPSADLLLAAVSLLMVTLFRFLDASAFTLRRASGVERFVCSDWGVTMRIAAGSTLLPWETRCIPDNVRIGIPVSPMHMIVIAAAAEPGEMIDDEVRAWNTRTVCDAKMFLVGHDEETVRRAIVHAGRPFTPT